MSRRDLYAAAAIVVVLVAAGSAVYIKKPGAQFVDHSMRTITIGGTKIEAEVVSSNTSREQGLSGRTQLPRGQGMLFVFDADGTWGIWMKDMQFSLDIVWAAKDGTIVTITKNVSPNTYPQVFYPSTSSRFVVELPAGFADAQGLAEGQKIMVQ